MLLDGFPQRADLRHSFAQPVAGNAKFLAPVTELVVLVYVDALVIRLSGLLQIVRHVALQIISLEAAQQALYLRLFAGFSLGVTGDAYPG
jgi:hypothetical protein